MLRRLIVKSNLIQEDRGFRRTGHLGVPRLHNRSKTEQAETTYTGIIMYNPAVLATRHYTENLFSFRVERPDALRFRSGEFIMLGLQVDGKPLMRAYSIASPNWHDELEFFSIKVPDGALTSRLQHLAVGDSIVLGKKPVGTLVLDALTPAENLYLFSTGTGVAPFASIVRDPETYEKFDRVILTHTCRTVAELGYGHDVMQQIREDDMLCELIDNKLLHFTSVTREEYPVTGRITDLIHSGTLYQHLDLAPLNPESDRAMICGSNDMLMDVKTACELAGLLEGANSRPAEFVVEKAFVG